MAGLIVPWNVPFSAACHKVAVALAAGCSFVLKPAEETPFTALRLGEMLVKAGVPAGVANIVTGFGETAGAALAGPRRRRQGRLHRLDRGRQEAGPGRRRQPKALTLELGGKSPVIVFADADLDAAAAGAARGVFTNSGQACIAGSRVFVQRGVFDAFVERLKRHAEALQLGDGFEHRRRPRPADLRSGSSTGSAAWSSAGHRSGRAW